MKKIIKHDAGIPNRFRLEMRFDWSHEHECGMCGATVKCADRECLQSGLYNQYTTQSIERFLESCGDDPEDEGDASLLSLRIWRCPKHELKLVKREDKQ